MKDECLICGAPLKYLENDELMECVVCHKKESSKTVCENGHYICNECHTQGMDSICSSDLHIKHGSVPRAVEGITVGHEMVGIVEEVGSAATHVKPGDRVTVNVEAFCGECFFCKKRFVNNCTDKNGGWALGCRIDGGQAEYGRGGMLI